MGSDCRSTPSGWTVAFRLAATVDGVVALTRGQMGYLLEAIDWRNPQHTWRPQAPDRQENRIAERRKRRQMLSFMIRSEPWMLIPPPCQTTSKR